MKLYKLKRLIYFFLYKLNRWLGGKTKWEYSDERYYPRILSTDYNKIPLARFNNKIREWKWLTSIDNKIVPDWIPDNKIEDYIKFREQFKKDFDKRWHGIHKRFD